MRKKLYGKVFGELYIRNLILFFDGAKHFSALIGQLDSQGFDALVLCK